MEIYASKYKNLNTKAKLYAKICYAECYTDITCVKYVCTYLTYTVQILKYFLWGLYTIVGYGTERKNSAKTTDTQEIQWCLIYLPQFVLEYPIVLMSRARSDSRETTVNLKTI